MALQPDLRQISMPLARSDDHRYQMAETLARDATWAAFVALQNRIPAPLLIEAAGNAVYAGSMSARTARRVLQSLCAIEPEDRSRSWLAGEGIRAGHYGGRPEILGETTVRAWACIHAYLDNWLSSKRGVDWGRLTPEGQLKRTNAKFERRKGSAHIEGYYSELF